MCLYNRGINEIINILETILEFLRIENNWVILETLISWILGFPMWTFRKHTSLLWKFKVLL